MATKRTKLWLISNYFYPVFGGGAERFRRYASGFRSRGIDLEVFTFLPPNLPKLPCYEVIDDIPITRFKIIDGYLKSHKLVYAVLNHLQGMENKPDVIQVFSISHKTMLPLLKMRFSGVKIVFVSTMVAEELQTGLVTRCKEWLYLRLSILPIDRVIASTTVMKKSLISRGISKKRIRVIPNGVDNKRFSPAGSAQESDQLRKKLGITGYDQVVLFVGEISSRKGIDLLIDAWSKPELSIQNILLVLVGAYHKQTIYPTSQKKSRLKYSKRIECMVENTPDKERIIFTGEVSNVEEYMRAADLFVFPSRQEGMGNVVLEAMATGLPCVLTPYVGLPTHEFGQAGCEFILIDDYDVEKLAFTINQLLLDKNRMITIGRLARKWVEKHMDIDKTLDQYAEMYRSVASIQHSSPWG